MGELSIINSKATGIDRKPQITSLLTATTWFRDVPNLYQVTADDPDLLDPGFGEILTISVDPESIAKGVKITSGSLIYWTPDRTQVGEHTMIVTVTDKAGALGKQSVTVAVAHPLFESPDNDTMAQATPIAVPNKMLKADLTVPSGTAKDVDYFKITLADNRKIRVSMITMGSNKYLLDILDNQGASVGMISLAGNSNYPVEQWIDLGLTAGNYFFKVQADQMTYAAAQVYGLMYLDLEGFNPPEQTITANYGTAYQDVLLNTQDRRYYLLSLTQPGALFISFTNPTQSDNRFLLKDSQGSVLEIFRLSIGLDLSAKVNLTSGDYTLAMEPAGYIDASEPFLLTFTSGPVDDGLEVEPNDTFQQANAIEVGKTMGGRISDDTDTDYYKLTLSTTKMLDFTFKTASSAPGHYNVDILIGDTVINHITAPGSGASSTLSAGLYPGDYFLRVTGTGVSSADDYTIEITEVADADRETEGNNTKAFANGLTAGTRKQARTHSDTDIDFFGVTFSSYGYFGITIKPMTQGVNFNVKVYNAEDRILMNFGAQGSGEAYEELYLWPGNYYVEVTGTHEGDYTLLFEGEGSALKELVKLAIVEAPQQIDVGKTAPLNLVGSYTDGSVIDLSTAQVNWTTSDAAKATVSGNVVSGIAAGPATIYANYGGQMAKVDLVVGGSVVDQKQAYGNLILLAGGGAAVTNTMKEATQYLANMVYSRFLGRGFRMEDIFYFNPVPWQDINGDGYGDPVVTEKTPTVVGLRNAIETWAAQQASTGPLYLVLIDHGGIDTFEVFPGEVITASQVHESLSVFQSLTGRDAVVMIEACKSGSFADDLAPAGSDRMVLTCTDEGNAYLELKGRISFTQFLMDRLFSGDTFRQSYLKTITKLSACGRPYSLMAPRLAEGKPYVLSQVRLGGNFAIAGIFPEILSQTEDLDVTAGASVPFSVTISDLSGQTKVWAVLEPPDYVPPGEVGDLEAPEVSLPTFDLTDEVNGVLDGIFVGSYGDFVYNGEHRIVFYARNADGLVTASPATIVTVTGGMDIPKVAGDLDADGFVTLADAIIGMRVLSGQGPAWVNKKAEVNGDASIGMAEVVYILQTVAGMR